MVISVDDEKEMEEILKRDCMSDKYNPEERMKEIVEDCPFLGREYETKSILIALAAGQNVVLYGKSGTGKTSFAEWAKKAFGAGECIETYSYRKYQEIDEIDKVKTNIIILEDYNYLRVTEFKTRYYMQQEIADDCSLRIKFENISDEYFKRMLLKENKGKEKILLSYSEITFWQNKVDKIIIPDEIIEVISKMHRNYNPCGDGEWYKAMQLVKAYAYFEGCEEVSLAHLNIFVDSVFHDRTVDNARIFREELLQRSLQSVTCKKETIIVPKMEEREKNPLIDIPLS